MIERNHKIQKHKHHVHYDTHIRLEYFNGVLHGLCTFRICIARSRFDKENCRRQPDTVIDTRLITPILPLYRVRTRNNGTAYEDTARLAQAQSSDPWQCRFVIITCPTSR